MATEQEELKLTVSLDDNASAQLANLRQQLAAMSDSMGAAGSNISGKSNDAAKGVKHLHGELGALAARAGFIGGVVSGITEEVSRFGAQLLARATDIDTMSRQMVATARSAREMGTSTAQLRSNLLAFREGGASVEQATVALQGFSDSMADLSLVNGRLRSELLIGGFLDVQKMQQTLARSDAAKTVQEQAGVWQAAGHQVREYWTALAGPQVGARREREFFRTLNTDLTYLNRQLREVSDWQRTLYERRDKGAEEFRVASERGADAMQRIAESAGSIFMASVTPGMAAIIRWATELADQLERAEKARQNIQDRAADAEKKAGGKGPEAFRLLRQSNPEAREATRFPWWTHEPEGGGQIGNNRGLPWWLGGGLFSRGGGNFGGGGWSRYTGQAKPEPADAGGPAHHFMGGGLPGLGPYSRQTGGLGDFLPGSQASTNIEDRRATDNNTETIGDLTREISRLNTNIESPMITGNAKMPGGLAASLGIGDIGGGGGINAGGTRYPGGGSGPGIGSGGTISGTGVEGGPATHGGAAGGGASAAGGMTGAYPRGAAGGAATYQALLAKFKGSSVIGKVPPGGEKFGIKTGSAEEWARFGTAVANAESGFNPRSANTSDPGGSFGIFQYAHGQVPGGNAYDPDKSMDAFVRDAESSVASGRGIGTHISRDPSGSILDRRFSTLGTHPQSTIGRLANYGDAGAGGGGAPTGTPGSAVGPGAVTAVGGAAPQAFIMHHTSGRGTVAGVQDTLRQRGLGVQYVMDREGNITQTGGPGAAHIRTGWGPMGSGLSNRNVVGMEVIAKNDRDVTEAQARAAEEFIARNYPNTPVRGHGQVNPGHKEADEGMTIVNRINAARARGQGGRVAGDARAQGAGVPAGGAVGFGNYGGSPFGPNTGSFQGTPVHIVSLTGDASRALGEANAAGLQRVWPSQIIKQNQDAVAGAARDSERQQLTQHLQTLEHEGARTTSRTPGVGGEAAPIGGAANPNLRNVPTPRRDPRTGQAFPRTPGVGGEAAPFGGAAPPRRTAAQQRAEHEGEIDRTRGRLDELNDEEDRKRGRSVLDERTKRFNEGKELDQGRPIRVDGNGKLDVNVKAPDGTDVRAEGSGLFKKTSIARQTQMPKAESGPTHSANNDEE